MAMMISSPSFYLESARRGLYLFANSVLPSIFPFYFCSLLLTFMGAVKGISALFQKPFRLLYNTPKESGYIFLLSVLCGYPVGASTCCELYLQDSLSQSDVKSISAFASTSGPVFILGTVGGTIFNDARVGVIILVSHIIASLINGLIFRKKHCEDYKVVLPTIDTDNVLSNTIAKSTTSMLYVGGYIVICGMIIDTMRLVGLDNLIISLLGESTGNTIVSILYGLIEMTRGTIECAKSGNLQLATTLSTAIITFGGLSINLQNYTYLSKCGMKQSEILIRKITQCIIALLISFLLSFSLSIQ